ncbi:MAG: DUF1501 domain-containing protein [Planctomycetota bacterium]
MLRREEESGFGPHFRPRAKRVIFLYMDGGPSQVDTFDPKPRLAKENGRKIRLERLPATQFDDVGSVLASPWKFRRRGSSGLEVSDLFPEVGACADELCVVRSMTSKFSEHPGANMLLHTGHGQAGRPSLGAWLGYGLGRETDELPTYVVVHGGLVPPGGVEAFGAGFLPAGWQGSMLRPEGAGLPNLATDEVAARRRRKLDLLADLDAARDDRFGEDPEIAAAMANYELAFRMQSAVPELMDLGGESEATRRLYGLDAEYGPTKTYARQCLLARRLVERGVRFVELTCPDVGADRWDQHQGLERGHGDNARAVDRPIAGLLRDLRSRGLLDDTLVVWAGEFGRTPMAQGSSGRDHNPYGFSIWMAGGGVKAGHVHGATDDYGYFAVDGTMDVHDLHATMLHLLGFDHTKLAHRHGGRDMRLTDVHGRVVRGLLA